MILTIHQPNRSGDCDPADEACNATEVNYNLIMDLNDPKSQKRRMDLDHEVGTVYEMETAQGLVVDGDDFLVRIPGGFRQANGQGKSFRVSLENFLDSSAKSLSFSCK